MIFIVAKVIWVHINIIKKQLKIIAKQKSLQQNVTITEDEEIYKKLSLVYREDNNLKWILMIFYVC